MMALATIENATKTLLTVDATPEKESLCEQFDALSLLIHRIALDKGWWNTNRNDGECIALMHSELSEALEGLRHNNPKSEHIPQFSAVEEEYADTIIRILDHSFARGWKVADAILAKIQFNAGRPVKHGGKEF